MVGQFLIAQAGTNLDASAPPTPARLGHAMIRPRQAEKIVTEARSLLTVDGIRFMFTDVVQNFMSFQAVGVIIVVLVDFELPLL